MKKLDDRSYWCGFWVGISCFVIAIALTVMSGCTDRKTVVNNNHHDHSCPIYIQDTIYQVDTIWITDTLKTDSGKHGRIEIRPFKGLSTADFKRGKNARLILNDSVGHGKKGDQDGEERRDN